MKSLLCAWLTISLLAPSLAAAEVQEPPSRERLKRVHEMRLRLEQERRNAENEARASVQSAVQTSHYGFDNPTVTQMRQDTAVQLARFEQSFRCLDVDVQNNGGNTVVICGGNSGDIQGNNTSAGGDLVIAPGGAR